MNHSMPGLPVHHQLPEFTKLTSIESVMPFSHLILCRPLLLLPPIPPSIRVFSNESTGQSTRVSALASFLPKNSAIKRNAFESVLMRWMNLDPIIHSKVSQKDKYRILMYIYGIQKNVTEEFTYRAAMEKQKWRTDL